MASSSGSTPHLPRASSLFLAMDTSGSQGSLALGRGTPAQFRREAPSGIHEVDILGRSILVKEEDQAALLVPRTQELLKEHGLGLKDLDGLVVGAGPGSFTGVRVGAATAKGLAWSLGVPVWAFSSLAGAAVAADLEPLRSRMVLFDARGDRLYAGAYRVRDGRVETVVAPRATTVREVLDGLVPPGALLMGDGARRHRDVLEGSGSSVAPHPAGDPDAVGLLRLLVLSPPSPPLDHPGRWEPDYLRDSGAERMMRGGSAGRNG